MKRLIHPAEASWKVLPQFFYKCKNLNTFFSAIHKLLSEQNIPFFYKDIHSLFMAHFKQQPINTVHTLTQSLWLNQHITSNRKTLYSKTWENYGITQIKDIFNKYNDLLSHQELLNKYNIRTTFLNTLTLHKCIPADWLQKLRHSSINALDVHTNLSHK